MGYRVYNVELSPSTPKDQLVSYQGGDLRFKFVRPSGTAPVSVGDPSVVWDQGFPASNLANEWLNLSPNDDLWVASEGATTTVQKFSVIVETDD